MLGIALIHIGPCATVDRERRDAAVLRNFRDAPAVLVMRVPSCARLQRHGRRNGLHHRAQNARNQILVLKQCGTPHSIAYLLGRPAHGDARAPGPGLNPSPPRTRPHLSSQSLSLPTPPTPFPPVVP